MARTGRSFPQGVIIKRFTPPSALKTQTLTEAITLTDSVTKIPGRILSEAITLTDTILKIPSRTFSEAITLTDTLIKTPGKVLSEAITLTDTLLKIPGKVLSEAITLTDTLIKLPGRTFSEAITLSATVLKQGGKLLSEAVTLSDTVLKIPGKVLTEAVSITDTLLKTAGKVLIEALRFSDADWALQFDGVQNYLNLGTMGNFGSNMGSGFYVSLSFKTTQTTKFDFGYYIAGGTSFYVCWNQVGGGAQSLGHLRLGIEDNSGQYLEAHTTNAYNYYDGTVHTLVMTANPATNTITITLDGTPLPLTYDSQNTPANFGNFGGNVFMGALNFNGAVDFMNCVLDNVKLGISSSTLYGLYLLNEGLGSTTVDESGNGNTGTLTGSPLPTWVTGLTATIGVFKQIGRIFSEAITLGDTCLRIISRILNETITLTDMLTIVKQFGRTFTEAVSVTDVLTTGKGKLFKEAITLADKVFINLNGQKWYIKIKAAFQKANPVTWFSKQNGIWEKPDNTR